VRRSNHQEEPISYKQGGAYFHIPLSFLGFILFDLFMIQPHMPFFYILFSVPHIYWCLINIIRRSVDA